jgi:hypothetical protein
VAHLIERDQIINEPIVDIRDSSISHYDSSLSPKKIGNKRVIKMAKMGDREKIQL